MSSQPVSKKKERFDPDHLLRVGFGFDVHRFNPRKKSLILAGVTIPAPFGIDAVSDGDVLLHAVSDALCGGAGLGDIGDHFPPRRKSSKGISSKKILKCILEELEGKYRLLNADVIIIAQRPRLSPHKKKMTESLKKLLKNKDVNIKIKSKENLEILGGIDALAVMATVLMKKCQN